jgi:hypothetical protein
MIAGALHRERTREKAALQRLAVELRSLLSLTITKNDLESPSKTKRKVDVEPPVNLEKTVSKESSEVGSAGTKKKPKKKKRSALANQSNPHHVDNCKRDA